MPEIKPFDGFLINADHAEEIVSPAYDSVSPQQRRIFAQDNPRNFLNTMRLLEDLPPDHSMTPEQLLLSNKENLDRLLSDGSFDVLEQPCLFIYQLDTGDHVQTGVVCEVPVSEYERGAMRKHENTRSDREDLLAQYQIVVGASSSPICLTYSQNPDIDHCVGQISATRPELEFSGTDGVCQRIWRITDAQLQAQLVALFAPVETTYLTDGHHRAASGYRYARIMRDQYGNTGEEPWNQLLVALFPDKQLKLLPFHRCVKGLNGLTESAMVAALTTCFDVHKLPGQTCFEPTRHGEFGMYMNNVWYQLNIKPEYIKQDDPVESLDVMILQNLILDPILGITDIRSNPRLDYIAGINAAEEIKRKCEEGWDIVFACHATSMSQLMDVADCGALMPPKSTYFDPKCRSGIFVRLKRVSQDSACG